MVLNVDDEVVARSARLRNLSARRVRTVGITFFRFILHFCASFATAFHSARGAQECGLPTSRHSWHRQRLVLSLRVITGKKSLIHESSKTESAHWLVPPWGRAAYSTCCYIYIHTESALHVWLLLRDARYPEMHTGIIASAVSDTCMPTNARVQSLRREFA